MVRFYYNLSNYNYTFFEQSKISTNYVEHKIVNYGEFITAFLSLDLKQIQNSFTIFDKIHPIDTYDSSQHFYLNQVQKNIEQYCDNKYLSTLLTDDIFHTYKTVPRSMSECFKDWCHTYQGVRNDIIFFFRNGFFEDDSYFNLDDMDYGLTIEFGINPDNHIPNLICIADHVLSLLALDLVNIISNKIQIKQCANCGRFFIPSKRSDEIYCDRINKNGKTCKDIGYSKKIKEDPFKNIFTTARKTQHARIRYNKHIKDYKEKHYEPWLQAATQARDKYKAAGDIEGFREWIEINKNAF